MAAIKFKTAKGVERGCEEGFGGIDDRARGRAGTSSSAFLENLDVSSGGALTLRGGYEHRYSFPSAIRGTLNTADGIYTACGNTLYFTDTESGSTSEICTLPSESGEVDVFFMSGFLHVLDGTGLYRFSDSVLTEIEGYAPLYGMDWDPTDRGEIYEDINVVSNRLRISYLLSESSTYFELGFSAASIDRIEINGHPSPLDRINYSFANDEQSVIEFRNIDAGKRVTFFITLAESSTRRDMLQKPSKAFIFTSNGAERLCIYHPGASNSMICSRTVSPEAYTASRKTNADSLDLYLPLSSIVIPGDGSSLINGMARHCDRALLFTETDTWCVDYEGEEREVERILPKVFLLNSAIGSEILTGIAHCGNDPLSYYRGGIWQWHSTSGVRDECSAELISAPISSLLPHTPEKILLLSVPHKQEIMIADPDDARGRVLIYNTDLGTFTTYSGIFADKLLLCGKAPAFTRDSEIYVFTDEAVEDIEDINSGDYLPIKSRLISHFCDFGTPEREKRSLRIIIDCEGSFEGLTLSMETEKGEIRSIPLKKPAMGGIISERIVLPRFRKLRYSLCTSAGRIQYNGIILSAK